MDQRKYISLSIASMMIFISLACSASNLLAPKAAIDSQQLQSDIVQILELYNAQVIPDHFYSEDPERKGNEFNISEIFLILDHLSMQSGHVLDYVYRNDPMGGSPVLYARLSADKQYETFSEYNIERSECFAKNNTKLPDCNYLDFVMTDGSEEGYLQLLILDMMGGQFYLDWHANYKDAKLVFTKEALHDLVNMRNSEDFGYKFSLQQEIKVSFINPIPQVSINDDFVNARVVWFTKWGGFYESQYSISKNFPHTIQEVKTINLVNYDCGIMF